MKQDLSLCIICRDDAVNLTRLITNARPWVGEIVVVDTGSTDSSPDVAREQGADIVHLAPELVGDDGILCSFSAARNLSFSLASRPWKMWLDSDDDMSDWTKLSRIIGLATAHRDITGPGFNVRLPYDYSWNDDRSRCAQSFSRERIVHADDGWSWHRPIHEYLGRDLTPADEPSVSLQTPRVIHMSQGARSRTNDRNLKVLLRWEREGGGDQDPVALNYYIGDELLNRGRYLEAFDRFELARLAKPCTTLVYWPARSAFRAARSLMCAGEHARAALYLATVIESIPNVADLRWELSRALSVLNRPKEAKEIFLGAKDHTQIPGEDPLLGELMAQHLGLT